jgi:NADPH:quinone reductase-like Zn-dependent oxidoreductase
MAARRPAWKPRLLMRGRTCVRRYHLNGKGIEALELVEEPAPEPVGRQVLVRVRANSLNQRDLMMIRGDLPQLPSVVPLSDGAGEVAAVGPDVKRWKAGDRVVGAFRQGWIAGPLDPALRANADLGGLMHGMLGEWALLDEEGLSAIPPALSFEEAATFPCAGVTAWSALMAQAPIRAGESVLVQGTGGVSLFALQIARMAGARVIATTSSPEKAERLRALGAETVIDYRAEPEWDEAVLRVTGGVGVDRTVEVGGAGTLMRSMRCTRMQGRIALVGLLERGVTEINPMGFMSRVLTLQGISVGARIDLEDAMAAFVANGQRPIVDRRFAFEDAKAALRHLEGKHHFGKVVIVH